MALREILSRSDLYGSIFPGSRPSSGRILEKSYINRSQFQSHPPNMNIDRSHSHSPNINIDRNNDRSILRPPVVVYITGDAGAEELRVCEAIESILQGYGIESQRQLASSDFLSDLGNRLGFVKCPRVFFRGRYIGGLIEVQDAYQLEAPSAVCTACGGHKFTLLHAIDDDKLINCSACRTQNQEAKSRAEKAEANFYKCYRKMKDDYDPVEAENMDSLVSLIHEDADCWSCEKYSEGEENWASDDNNSMGEGA